MAEAAPFRLNAWPARRRRPDGSRSNGLNDLYYHLACQALEPQPSGECVYVRAVRRAFGLDVPISIHGILTVARIREDGGFWEPDTDSRSKASWHWIAPVRINPPGGTEDHFRFGDEWYGREVALNGLDCIDLFALSPDLSRVTSRYTGFAPVLGWPLDPDMAETPIPIHATPRAWLEADLHGVVLGPDEAENCHYLRNAAAGLIVPNVATGKAIGRLLKRPAQPLPALYVEDEAARAARLEGIAA